jgi:hypothetical protein
MGTYDHVAAGPGSLSIAGATLWLRIA